MSLPLLGAGAAEIIGTNVPITIQQSGEAATLYASQSLRKDGASGWNCYVWSSETVTGDCDISFVTEDTDGGGFFGFTDAADTSTGYTSIIGFWRNGAGTLTEMNHGANGSFSGAYTSGQKLSVHRTGSTYSLRVDGGEWASFTGPAGAIRFGGVMDITLKRWPSIRLLQF